MVLSFTVNRLSTFSFRIDNHPPNRTTLFLPGYSSEE